MQIEQKQNRIYKPQSNTTLSAEETNQVTTELENVIRAGNLTPNAGTLTQVRDAIQNVVDTSANELQEQIDAITSASDVFDVVGTYAQLQAYDTSTVPVNDIIKVLQDESRDNAMTYYRWNGTAWVFIGAEGPYYTVSETDTKFATKADLPGIATVQQAGLVKPDGQTTIVQQDGTLSVSSNVAASLPLFTPIWSDHIINDASYLRADTFSWQSGAVYVSAYNHLAADISGITSETETIAGTTITFKRATDVHKIVLADQAANLEAIYNATGIGYYFILDTTNKRFKLPRNIYGFTGYRGHAGNYVAPTLPNIKGFVKFDKSEVHEATGAFLGSTDMKGRHNMYSANGASPGAAGGCVNLNAYDYNPIYQDGATVQPPAVQTYLYFYVGNTVQNETTVDVGELTDAVNGKADTDLANLTASGKNLGSSLGKPNNSRSVLLTIGASGTKYTAPGNGWYMAKMKCSATGGWVRIIVEGSIIEVVDTAPYANNWVSSLVPVCKGETVRLEYGNVSSAAGDREFRFYYDVGAE